MCVDTGIRTARGLQTVCVDTGIRTARGLQTVCVDTGIRTARGLQTVCVDTGIRTARRTPDWNRDLIIITIWANDMMLPHTVTQKH